MDEHGQAAAPIRTPIEEEQQRVILEESEARKLDREAAPDTHLEHRRSEETVEPVESPLFERPHLKGAASVPAGSRPSARSNRAVVRNRVVLGLVLIGVCVTPLVVLPSVYASTSSTAGFGIVFTPAYLSFGILGVAAVEGVAAALLRRRFGPFE